MGNLWTQTLSALIRARYGLRLPSRTAGSNVVGFVFNGKCLHAVGPCAAFAAVTTLITWVADKGKQILRQSQGDARWAMVRRTQTNAGGII
jgi:hypothetical protein